MKSLISVVRVTLYKYKEYVKCFNLKGIFAYTFEYQIIQRDEFVNVLFIIYQNSITYGCFSIVALKL